MKPTAPLSRHYPRDARDSGSSLGAACDANILLGERAGDLTHHYPRGIASFCEIVAVGCEHPHVPFDQQEHTKLLRDEITREAAHVFDHDRADTVDFERRDAMRPRAVVSALLQARDAVGDAEGALTCSSRRIAGGTLRWYQAARQAAQLFRFHRGF